MRPTPATRREAASDAASTCVVTTTVMAEPDERARDWRRRCWRERTARHRARGVGQVDEGDDLVVAAARRARDDGTRRSSTTTSSSSRARWSRSPRAGSSPSTAPRSTRSRSSSSESDAGPAPAGHLAHHRDRATASSTPTPASTCPTPTTAPRCCCPKDPDRSARRLRAEIRRRRGVDVAVVITDTFGRVWRQGVTDVAIGSAGLRAGTGPARHDRRQRAHARGHRGRDRRRDRRGGATSCWARPTRRRSRCCAVSTSPSSATGSVGDDLVRRPSRGPVSLRPRRGARRPTAREPGATCSFAPTTQVAPRVE